MIVHEITTNTDYDLEVRKNSGEELMLCPKCSHLRQKKTVKCLSFNHNKNVGRCNHCEAHFVLKKEFIPMQENKVYVLPKFNNQTTLSDNAVNYFFKRGISQKTLTDFKISEGMEYMPQTEKNENTLQFNYFRYDQLVNIKYRDGRKNFKLVKDAELIPYNVNSIIGKNEIIICEGEIDAMSWHEAGFESVISVPNGANIKLDWLDTYADVFERAERIYLSTDNDDKGFILRDELARRLGYDKCLKVDFSEHKDANEYLVAKGKESLLETLKMAKEFPLVGVFGIDDCWDDIMHIYHNGMPTGYKSGDRQFDEHLGCMPGELTMVTGIPGHGKSIYLDQISIGLCINEDWKFGVCSPESHPMSFYFTRLIKRLVGKKFSKFNIDENMLMLAKDWVKDRYNLIKPDDGYSLDSILNSAKSLVLRKGIKGLILDPWNRIENTKPNGMQEGEWVVQCLVKIITFAQKTGVHVFLVAHPTKMPKVADGSNFIVPNLYSISGSAHFFNMTQNGFTIFRNMATDMTEVHFQKVKWEHLGHTGIATYLYNSENARFYEPGDDPNINWLIKKEHPIPEVQVYTMQPSQLFDEQDAPF